MRCFAIRRAVEMAKRVLPPSAGHYWRYLALAQYRSQQWQDAADSIQQAMDLRQGGDAFDWLLLAMAQWQLGQKDAALEKYSQAQEAIKTSKSLFYEYLGVMAVQRLQRSGGADGEAKRRHTAAERVKGVLSTSAPDLPQRRDAQPGLFISRGVCEPPVATTTGR